MVAILALVTALVTLLLRLWDGWDRWHQRRTLPTTHPLDAALRDIAQAVRESGGQV